LATTYIRRWAAAKEGIADPGGLFAAELAAHPPTPIAPVARTALPIVPPISLAALRPAI
jgi:hypothetical protein